MAGILEEICLYRPFDPAEPSLRVPSGLEGEVAALVHQNEDFNAELRALRRLLQVGVFRRCVLSLAGQTWQLSVLGAGLCKPSVHAVPGTLL